MKKTVLIIVTLLILTGISYAFYVWNKPARDVTNEDAIKISAIELFNAYEKNEQSANTRFLNKALEVTGKVSNVKKNQLGKTVVYLQSGDEVFGINCTFKKEPGEIEKGQTITYKGICTGYLSDVILNEGLLMK